MGFPIPTSARGLCSLLLSNWEAGRLWHRFHLERKVRSILCFKKKN